jgi:hypothetical protein
MSHPHRTITDPDFPVFLALSSLLTDFSETELEGTGMLEEYYWLLMKEQDHEVVRAFLRKAKELLSEVKDPVQLDPGEQAAIGAALGVRDMTGFAERPFDELPYDGLAQRLALLWVDGTWTTMNGKDTKSQQDRTAIPTARAYQQALKWLIAETHPAGAKQPGFGSWSEPPIHS